MVEQEVGAPFFFVTDEPTATSIDDDIYLTLTAAVPGPPGRVEEIDIVLSVEHAKAAIAALSSAVTAASRNAAE